ncbi:MAG: Ig-like domain-containing protein, partial [Terracidiphilus sp.]
NQTLQLNPSGQAVFSFTNLSGGTYHVLVTYAGQGVLNPPCSGSDCFAGSAAESGGAGFPNPQIAPATPAIIVGPPGVESCLSWTQSSSCTPAPKTVTSYLGTYFVQVGRDGWFTGSVTATGLPLAPTGSVSFEVNGKPVDPTQPQNPLSGGLANFSTSNLPTGTYTITAHYSGDQNYAPVNFAIPTFEVIVPSVEVTAAQSATPPALSTKAGTPVQETLYLMPLVGFSGQVTLQCVSASLPQYAECTFAYPNSGTGTIGVVGTSPSTIVVTISTNVPVNSGSATASIARRAPWALASLFGLGMLGLIAGRKRCNRYMTMVGLVIMLSGAFMGVTSCTNAGYSTPPSPPHEVTPPGTSNVQIISVSPSNLQQNSLVSTPPYTLQLTVQ